MLPDRYRRLLTARVDGELSEREGRLVARLLERSEEARALFRRLEEDAARLRRLPAPPAAPDLSRNVLDAIARERVHPNLPRPRTLSRPPAYPPWAGLVTAAAVLVVIGLSSYLYFSTTPPDRNGQPVLARGEEHVLP